MTTRNIYDLTNLLRVLRSKFQTDWNNAEEKKKDALKTLKETMIPNTPVYKQKEKEIKFDFEAAIVLARIEAAEKAAEAFEDLRQRELARLERIDEEALAKVNALRDLPLSEVELKQILKKFGSNVWIQKAISTLAEQNGISTSNLPLDTSIDTKLNVISGLEEQLDKLLRDYDRTANTPAAANARFLWLNDDVLRNSEEIYTNGVVKIKELDAVTQAYLKIRAAGTQMAKTTLISNSLRNIKQKDSRNLLFYKLSQDNTIMTEAFKLTGIDKEMEEWKHGKSERFIKCSKLIDEIRTEQDTTKIIDVLQNYLKRIEQGTEHENEFLPDAILKAKKKNKAIIEALANAGFTYTEKKTLLGEAASIEQKPVLGNSQATENNAEDSYAIAYKAALDKNKKVEQNKK